MMGILRPIPLGFGDAVVLDPEDRFLYVAYRGRGAVLVYDAQAIISEVEDPANAELFGGQEKRAISPINDLVSGAFRPNAAIDVKADFRPIVDPVTGKVAFGVPNHDPNAAPPVINPRAPISTGGLPGGLAVQPGLCTGPLLEHNGLEDRLFTNDLDFFTLFVGNDAQGPRSEDCIMRVKITVEGNPAEFLKGIQNEHTWNLGPQQSRRLRVHMQDLIPQIKPGGIEEDRLYGVKINVRAFQKNDESNELLNESFYVYRYLDAADGNLDNPYGAHTDGVLQMIDALVVDAGTPPVERFRNLEFRMPASADPASIEVDDETHFQFLSSANKFRFVPEQVGQDLEANVLITNPDGELVKGPKSLKIRGEGQGKIKLNVNTVGLVEVLDSIANHPFAMTPLPIGHVHPALITSAEKSFFDAPVEQTIIANDVDTLLETVLAPYSDAVELIDLAVPSSDADTINIVWATRDNGSALADFDGVARLGEADRVDDAVRLFAVSAIRKDLTATLREFLLAESLNPVDAASVEVFVDSILEIPYGQDSSTPALNHPGLSLSLSDFISMLRFITSHEVGHTLGLLHTGLDLNIFKKKEIQTLTLSDMTGANEFILTFDGESTSPIPSSATTIDINLELAGLPNIDDAHAVLVTTPGAGGTDFNISFEGVLKGVDVPQIGASVASGPPGFTATVGTHQQGLVETSVDSVRELSNGAVLGRNDIMFSGMDFDLSADFQPGLTAAALKLALKLNCTDDEADAAMKYIFGNWDKGPFLELPSDIGEFPGIEGPRLAIRGADGGVILDGIDFGTSSVDGVGGSQTLTTLSLINVGFEDVHINSVELLDASGYFSASGIVPGTTLVSDERILLQLTFDPLASGEYSATLLINSDDPAAQTPIELVGFGLSPDGDITVEVPNRNLGGLKLGEPTRRVEAFGIITNQGAIPLAIYNVRVIEGNDQFAVGGLPNGLGPANPLVLDPGQSQGFDLFFNAAGLGLQRGVVEIFSDDPDTPLATITVVGTGSADSGTAAQAGNDFIAIEIPFLPGSPVVRLGSDAEGDFDLAVPPDEPFHYVVFDPTSGLVAHEHDIGAPEGEPTPLFEPVYFASIDNDSDGDGLPDDIEFALGSNLNRRDTNRDGIDDFDSIQQGIDPIGPNFNVVTVNGPVSPSANRSIQPLVLEGPASADLAEAPVPLTEAELQPIVKEAKAQWTAVADNPTNLTALNHVVLDIADLTGSSLGWTTRTVKGDDVITIDQDAAGYGWFVDASPADSIEFGQHMSDWEFRAMDDSEALGRIDLLTVVLHELGHVLGLADRDKGVEVMMSRSLQPGVRRVPTPDDLQGAALVASNASEATGASDGLTYLSSPLVALDPDDLPHNIVNGSLDINNPADPAFGWTTQGGVAVVNSQAVLDEGAVLLTGLSQTFLVPDGAGSLRFTIVSSTLGAGELNPPDAFEVALLAADTMAPLVGPADGLGDTDALLNIQADGTLYYAGGVTLPGAGASGEAVSLTLPLTVTVDLSSIAAETAVTLYFDLIGFGAIDSIVVIDNVQLLTGGQTPPKASSDTASTAEGTAVDIDVLNNDEDPDEGLDRTSVVLVTEPAHGTARVLADGTIRYTPNENFSGTDRIDYTVSDTAGTPSNPARVDLTVVSVANTPTLTVQPAQGDANTSIPLNITASLADGDGSETLAILIEGLPIGAVLSAGRDIGGGSFTLTPEDLIGLTLTPALDSGEDFTLTVTATATEQSNNNSASVQAFLEVTVHAVNIPPTVEDQTFSVAENSADGTAVGTVVAGDPDAGDTLTFAIVGGTGSTAFALA